MTHLTYIEGAEPEGVFTAEDGERARAFAETQMAHVMATCWPCGGTRKIQPTRQVVIAGRVERVASGEPHPCRACAGKP